MNYLVFRAIISSIRKPLFIVVSLCVYLTLCLTGIKKGHSVRDCKPKPTEQEAHLLLQGFENYQRAVLFKK